MDQQQVRQDRRDVARRCEAAVAVQALGRFQGDEQPEHDGVQRPDAAEAADRERPQSVRPVQAVAVSVGHDEAGQDEEEVDEQVSALSEGGPVQVGGEAGVVEHHPESRHAPQRIQRIVSLLGQVSPRPARHYPTSAGASGPSA